MPRILTRAARAHKEQGPLRGERKEHGDRGEEKTKVSFAFVFFAISALAALSAEWDFFVERARMRAARGDKISVALLKKR